MVSLDTNTIRNADADDLLYCFVQQFLDAHCQQMKRHMTAGDVAILDSLTNQDKILEDIIGFNS